MANHIKDRLEEERIERLKELGYLCYNLSLGSDVMSDFETTINVMRACANNMTHVNGGASDLLSYREMLDEKAAELGCACFNRYIDKELLSGGMLEICASISELNSRIANSAQQPEDEQKAAVTYTPECWQTNDDLEYDNLKQKSEVVFSVSDSNHHSDLRMNYPYGMEPIPTNAKICTCGYRNREYAVYCGRCGVKL